MDKIFFTKFSVCKRLWLLSLIAAMFTVVALDVNAQGEPKKPRVMRRNISTDMPGGYTQLGTTDLIYNNQVQGYRGYKPSIDFLGKYNGKYYGSTYSNCGYEVAMQVGENAAEYLDCYNGSTVYGVTFAAEVVQQAELGRVCYYLTNTNAEDVTISLGIHADVMIGDNDAAPIRRKIDTMGNTYALSLLDGLAENSAQLCVLFGNGLAGVTGVDDFWFGTWNMNSNASELVGNYDSSDYNWMVENGSYDSGMGWCWKNRVIPAGATVTFSWLIGVGDVSLEPYSNYEVTPENPELWNDLSLLHVLKIEGDYESPAGLAGKLQYQVEGTGDWIDLTEMLESGSTFTGTIKAMFDPSLAVHRILLRTVDNVGNTALLKPIEYKDVSFHALTGIEDKVYTGEEIVQTGLVCDLDAEHYTFIYSNNKNVGTATMRMEGVYPYTIGRKTYTFQITPQPLTGTVNIADGTYVYNGEPFTPSWSFSNANYADLVLNTDYTVAWTNNIVPGTATLTVTGIGNYTGSLSSTFTIDKAPITADLYTLTLPEEDVTYDGENHGASVVTATGVGVAVISYTTKNLTDYTTTEPKNPGDYDIYLDIAESDLYYGLARTKVFTFSIYQFDDGDWAAIQTLKDELTARGWTGTWDLSGGPAKAKTLSGLTIKEGRVIGIDLSAKNVTGTIPPSIFNFTQLQTLNLSDNKLTGNLGAYATNINANTTTLNVSGNYFDEVTPMLPPSVANLNISNQTIDKTVNLNLAAPVSTFIADVPNILLYNHATQSYATNIGLLCSTGDDSWKARLVCQDGQKTFTQVSADNVYRGANGDLLKAEVLAANGAVEGSSFKVALLFASGDGNFDGQVSVLDLQTDVNYIFNNYNVNPFNFTAANMVVDAVINVQDIVVLVNKLFETAPAPMAASRRAAADEEPAMATLSVQNGNLVVNTANPVAAFDIMLSGANAIQLSETLKQRGLVCESRQVNGGVRLIAYSLSGGCLSVGETVIGKVSSTAEVVSAVLADREAASISVALGGGTTGINVTEMKENGDAYLLRLGNGHAISIEKNGKKTLIQENRNMK